MMTSMDVIHEAVEVVLEVVEDIDKGEKVDDAKRGPRTEPWGTPVVNLSSFMNQAKKEIRIY